jgi:hypothetical protein
MVDELPDTRIALELLQDFFLMLQTNLGRTFKHDLFMRRATRFGLSELG